MIVYSSDNNNVYKNDGRNNAVTISEKDVQATTSTELLPKKLPTAGVRLSLENKKFLIQLGFKLTKC